MSGCNCSDFEPCADKPNCRRYPDRSTLKLAVSAEKRILDECRGQLEHRMIQPDFVKLPRAERDRLTRQSIAMEQYSQILFERLEANFQ